MRKTVPRGAVFCFIGSGISSIVAGSEPQATEKFFGAAVFQKCCRGVGE